VQNFIAKQNCFWKIVGRRSQDAHSMASTSPYVGKSNTLVCLRCIYGFPNPILFDYKTYQNSFA